MDQHLKRVQQAQHFFTQQNIHQTITKAQLAPGSLASTIPHEITPIPVTEFTAFSEEREKEILAYAKMELYRLTKVRDRLVTDLEGIFLYEDDKVMTDMVETLSQRIQDLEHLFFELPKDDSITLQAKAHYQRLSLLRHQKMEMLDEKLKDLG